MAPIAVNELWTLLAALLTIQLGIAILARVPLLARYSIPPAVVGGFVVAVALTGSEAAGWKFSFATGARGALLLVFFTTLGLSARLGKLRGGGVAVALIALAILLLAVGQNAVGAGVARLFGQPPALAVFLGSAAFLGGHGTTTAWAEQELARAAGNAFEVGMACATLGLACGGVLGSVVATRLLARGARAPASAAVLPEVGEVALHDSADAEDFGRWTSSDRWLRQMLVLGATTAVALLWQRWLAGRGVTVPPFLACLLTAVAVTNVADLLRHRVDMQTADLLGTVALRLFLAMSLMSLDLIAVLRAAGLILTAVALQCLLTTLIAVTLVRWAAAHGSTGAQAVREGAVAAGGFMGFGLGAMPVGLTVMQRITLQHGAAPRAFLVVTLAASLLQDVINAGAVQAALAWAAR
ncbi:MAG TPA: sodium/glutamate symporter [Rubrivivax sp.]|nr:sodium/glutamate symporter [Rubrivivax sp.]